MEMLMDCGAMQYDGALVMPSSYAMMNEDEMTYVDGGNASTLGQNLLGLWNKSQGLRFAFKLCGVSLSTIYASSVYSFWRAVDVVGEILLRIAPMVGGVAGGLLAAGTIAGVVYLWNKRVFY